MPDKPDWSKLSGVIRSRASDALNEVQQFKDSISKQDHVDLPEIDWSKLSGAIASRASDALNEVKQLKVSISQQDHIDLPHIDWSKLSGGMMTRASETLKEVKRLKDFMSQQDHVHLPHIDWSKLSDGILTYTSGALNEVKRLNLLSTSRNWSFTIATVFQQQQVKLRRLIEMSYNVSDSGLSKLFASTSNLRGTIVSGASEPQGIIFSSAYYALTKANKWAIRHPYVATGAFLCISANPELLLTPLQLVVHICLLPFKVLGRFMMFSSPSIDSFSQHQSSCCDGYIPRDSAFTKLQSHKESVRKGEWKLPDTVSWLSGTGAVFVLGRTWGWKNLLKVAGALALLCVVDVDEIN